MTIAIETILVVAVLIVVLALTSPKKPVPMPADLKHEFMQVEPVALNYNWLFSPVSVLGMVIAGLFVMAGAIGIGFRGGF